MYFEIFVHIYPHPLLLHRTTYLFILEICGMRKNSSLLATFQTSVMYLGNHANKKLFFKFLLLFSSSYRSLGFFVFFRKRQYINIKAPNKENWWKIGVCSATIIILLFQVPDKTLQMMRPTYITNKSNIQQQLNIA